MLKHFKYILVALIAMTATTACQEDSEDAFSQEPVAPVLTGNGAIFLTEDTMDETIRWAWTAARFMQGETTYTLYARYGENDPVQVGEPTQALTMSMTKTEFKTFVDNLEGIPTGTELTLTFHVEADDEVGTYKSNNVAITVYTE